MYRIILLLFLGIGLQAQDPFSIEPNPSYGEGTVFSNFFNADAEIFNQTDSTITVMWERIIQDIPTGWESSICLNFTCLPPDVDTGHLVIDAGYSLDLNQTFFPHEIAGSGRVELKVWVKGDTSFIINPEYFGSVETTSVFETNAQSKYSLFPNPTSATFSLDKNLDISSLKIFNAQGKLVQTYTSQPDYNIEFLPPNFYYVQVFSEQKEVLAVLKLTKL